MDRSSAGDPVRTLELLWRAPHNARAARGPKQRTSIDAVVAAAIHIADTDGLSALTIRAVAKKLGIAPMATYTYVPGKAELLDLILDSVYLDMPRTDISRMHWREKVSIVATENRTMLVQHPWVVQLATTRPPLGPGTCAKYEHELHAFDGLGLSDLEMDSALTYVLGFVTAVARIAIDTSHARVNSGINDRTWWERAEPLLAKVFNAEKYPLAARVGAAAGQAYDSAYNADHAYEFGLARVLDGLATVIDHPPG
ncbi:TetR/AcrR family transcriptional regulator [Mycolicibacterium iranicum]|uniref:TetR/AcrR family transcriptional regulator n=1 Tax=Mycolicibacterium iranicum TaxID=912594 RepID=UPI000AC0B91B|nr:TetR/AcrR family transcriptional regulator C-terminal domain-containing protein [Mycolicibacterium iranicum]